MTADMPKISIITVVLNNVACVERAMLSVLEQSYANLEYIIVDGGSTDGTLEIVDKYKPLLSHVISEPDAGIYDAMNKGIRIATGSLVGIVNSDDWLDAEVVYTVAQLHKNSTRAIIYGLVKEYRNGQPWRIHTTHHGFIRERMIPHQTCFIPKAIYDEHGLYDTQYRYLADYDFLLRCASADVEFELLEQVVSNASMGGATHSNMSKAKDEQLRVLRQHKLLSPAQFRRSMFKIWMKNLIKQARNYHFSKQAQQ